MKHTNESGSKKCLFLNYLNIVFGKKIIISMINEFTLIIEFKNTSEEQLVFFFPFRIKDQAKNKTNHASMENF